MNAFPKSITFKNDQNLILKRFVLIGLILYSTVLTVAVIKMSPKVMIIAVEDSGTRVVTSENDAALKKEKETFLKKFISKLYIYDASTYRAQISEAGDYMTKELWKIHEEEFTKRAAQLKNDDLSEGVKILDLREIDSETYQADLELNVVRKLERKSDHITVDLKLRKSKRELLNPYDMEVTEYAEHAR